MKNTAAIDHETTSTDDLPPCCRTSVRMVQLLSRAVTCTCGEVYYPDERTSVLPDERAAIVPDAPREPEVARVHRATMPGPAPRDRGRVYLAAVDGEVRRSSVPLPAAKARVPIPTDDSGKELGPLVTVERVAVLLEELQADVGDDRAGGVSWAPPSEVASPRYDRERIQVSAGTPSGPNLAALIEAYDDERPTVVQTIVERVGADGPNHDTLCWLREESCTTPARLRTEGERGLRELLGVVGYQFAPAEIRERFDASKEVLNLGAPIRGRWLVEAAMVAWWGRNRTPGVGGP